MATSKRAAVGFAVLAVGSAGCGGGGKAGVSTPGTASAATSTPAHLAPAVLAGGFGWLHPQAPPAGWHVVRISSGAAMPYPAGWQEAKGDKGTATAVLRDDHGGFLGYLNLTPKQGQETLGNWSLFRGAHNAKEGDRNVKTLAAAQGLRFRDGYGTCVRDTYTTSTGARFVELACLVAGLRGTSVIVGAAPPGAWNRLSPSIERAISAFTT